MIWQSDILAPVGRISKINGLKVSKVYQEWTWPRCKRKMTGSEGCREPQRFLLTSEVEFLEIPNVWHHQNTTKFWLKQVRAGMGRKSEGCDVNINQWCLFRILWNVEETSVGRILAHPLDPWLPETNWRKSCSGRSPLQPLFRQLCTFPDWNCETIII